MPEIMLEQTIPVYAQAAWLPELCNPYISLPGVSATARLASRHPSFFTHLAIFICSSGGQGYTRGAVKHLKKSVPRLPGLGYHEACDINNAIDRLATDYEQQLGLSDLRGRSLANDFTAAISEAIVRHFLLRSNRPQSELIPDCHFRIGGGEQSRCNIDLAWFRKSRCRLDLYECKHGPQRLLGPWYVREHEGNQHNWQKSQLHLMLSVHDALTSANWTVYLCCITLRQRNAIASRLEVLGCPPELKVYAQEDLGSAFPPPV